MKLLFIGMVEKNLAHKQAGILTMMVPKIIRIFQLRPDLEKTYQHGTYPAYQNKYLEDTDLMVERFISGIVMVDNWGYTTAFMSGIADYKQFYNDTITAVNTRYVATRQSSHPSKFFDMGLELFLMTL